MKRINKNGSLQRAVLKNSIGVISLICASTLVQADTISKKIDLGEPFPFRMEDGVEYEINVDVGYQFDSINKICINAEVDNGTATAVSYLAKDESADPFLVITPQLMWLYKTFELPTPENPNPVPQLQKSINICQGENSTLAKSFLDGEGEFTYNVSGGYIDFWDIELVIEGDVSDIRLAIEIDEPAEFSVPSYGGRVNYDASIRNLDSTQSLVTLEQWSVLKFPNGDNYPIHKSRDVVLNYSEAKDYTRNYLNIPAWFEAGDYELTWYVTDPNTGVRVKDSLSFTKSAD
ncbi:RbmA family biofilm matrix protein [Microbulbifer epialgicus]|uniref:RbmA-like FnIII domain-containing protein n=1 Tax=Microbulbifer epialgicus TaxID=393907 RepID=A0ABV4P5W4_9GAMM